MSDNSKYNLFLMETMGWELQKKNLTKEECDKAMQAYFNDGISPDRIRVRRIS